MTNYVDIVHIPLISNEEASASKLLEHIEEMFPRYYMDGTTWTV